MALFGDIVGDDADAVARATSEVVRIANARAGEGFVAVSAEARKKFWLDRKRTAAISKHTNAFKINEDVVIPLDRMGEYTEGIERINIELSLANKLALVDRLEALFRSGNLPLWKGDDASEIASAELLEDRVQQALAVLRDVGAQWRGWLNNLDRPAALLADLDRPAPAEGADGRTVFAMLQDHTWRASWKAQIRKPFESIFAGTALKPILDECNRIHAEVLRGRVWVALHMHAGDGNVHTNIPVNSDNYEMLQTAHTAVARIMKLARSLDGVISGEHGIGITKLEFLSDDEIADFTDYKRRVDPEGRFNQGKLLRDATFAGTVLKADLTNAYTPSFGLMGHESLIMQQSDIGEIANSIKDCLRCGKCKPACATHVPRANLLYSPRNKILATSLLIEAFLYEEQTRRGVSIRHWEEFEDVADHCTVCHKCLSPCPVDIDFGDVSMNMRNLLRKMGQKSFRPASKAAMLFLNATSPETIKVMRTAMVDIGFKAQRAANNLLRGLANAQTAAPPSTAGTPPLKEQVIHFINKKMPGGLPKRTARALLDIEDKDYVPIIRNPKATNADTEAVFYFPGCGSERLFSQVGLATQAMLWHAGVQTVLPPGYLCCGYPQRGSGDFDKAEKIITDNRVLFHRVANTLNYLDIKTVVVSCGTCYDQLQGYEFEQDLPRLPDHRHPRVPAREGHHARRPGRRRRGGAGLPVPRPVPQPDEAARAADDGEGAGRRERAGRATAAAARAAPSASPGPTSRRRCAFARKRSCARTRRRCARRRGDGDRAEGRPEDPDLVPELPAGPAALQGRPRERPARGRLHRRRDGQPHPRRGLDAGVRGARQRRRHRARAGVAFRTTALHPIGGGAAALGYTAAAFDSTRMNDRPLRRHPTSITVHQQSRVLEVGFDDGASFRIPFELMRIYSPSAEVQGHGPGQEILQTGKREVERRRRSSRSATTPCCRASPTATRPASSRGTTSTSSARSRTSCGSKYEERLAEAGVDRDAPMGGSGRRRRRCGPLALSACSLRRMSDTHFGFSSVDERAKAERVRGVFDSVAPKYDVMNDLMSLGLHRAWKAYAVAVADVRAGRRGARPRRRHRRPGARLRRAGRRARPRRAHRHQRGDAAPGPRPPARRRHRCCRPLLCDAESLPFASGVVRPRQRRLRPAQHDAQGQGAGRDGARAEAGRAAARARVLEGRGAARQGLRLVLVQRAAAHRPVGRRRRRRATATSPNRSACIPTRRR